MPSGSLVGPLEAELGTPNWAEIHSALGQSHAQHHSQERCQNRGGQLWTLSSVWSLLPIPAGPCRVTGLWGQAPGRTIQIAPDPHYPAGLDGLGLLFSSVTSSLLLEETYSHLKLPWSKFRAQGGYFPLEIPAKSWMQTAGHHLNLFAPGSGSVPQTHPQTKHSQVPIALTLRYPGALLWCHRPPSH